MHIHWRWRCAAQGLDTRIFSLTEAQLFRFREKERERQKCNAALALSKAPTREFLRMQHQAEARSTSASIMCWTLPMYQLSHVCIEVVALHEHIWFVQCHFRSQPFSGEIDSIFVLLLHALKQVACAADDAVPA